MGSLYEIESAIMNCVDAETGEVIDIDLLEHLEIERSQKIENICCYIKNLISDADAIKAEKAKLSKREEVCRNKAEQLKNYLTSSLNGQKFSSARCAVSYRKSESVEIVDMDKIPKKYLVKKVELKPDKDLIKTALKEGVSVKGCVLCEKSNIQIK